MTTKRIEFQMMTPGGPHTACVEATVSDNGDFESIVSVPRLNIRRIEDLDALIAALREARGALVADGAGDDIEQLRQDVRDAQAVVDDLMAQPNPLDAPAAPVRETPRLTRAQREALAFLSQDGAQIWKRSNEALRVFHTFIDGEDRNTLELLCMVDCVEMVGYDVGGTWTRYALTPQGRLALAAAQRGDAIRAPRGAQRSDGEG